MAKQSVDSYRGLSDYATITWGLRSLRTPRLAYCGITGTNTELQSGKGQLIGMS